MMKALPTKDRGYRNLLHFLNLYNVEIFPFRIC